MIFAANVAIEPEVIVAAITVALFIFIHVWCRLHQHKFNRSRV